MEVSVAKFSRTITFEDARAFVMPFGKFQGQTLEEIASTPEGLRYLDWAIGRFETEHRSASILSVVDHLRQFVDHPEVSSQIDEALSHQHDTVDAPEWTPRDWSWLPPGKGGKS